MESDFQPLDLSNTTKLIPFARSQVVCTSGGPPSVSPIPIDIFSTIIQFENFKKSWDRVYRFSATTPQSFQTKSLVQEDSRTKTASPTVINHFENSRDEGYRSESITPELLGSGFSSKNNSSQTITPSRKRHVERVTHRQKSSLPFLESSSSRQIFQELTSVLNQNPPESIETIYQRVRANAKRSNSYTNHNMQRVSSINETKNQDPEYLEKRKKNNESAKRSRDARRAKEEELAAAIPILHERANHLERQVEASIQLIALMQYCIRTSSD